MLVRVPELLPTEALAAVRALLADAPWESGLASVGPQGAAVKNNQQLPARHALTQQLQAQVMQALKQHPLFFSAALPKKVLPPSFNRYGGDTNFYGNHVDGAVRYVPDSGERVRTDISCTLFLAEPGEYDGGELVIEDSFGEQRVKLAAGDAILYPGTSVHRVEPVTRGARIASFFWIESMVRSDEQRRMLHDMDMALMRLRARDGESDEAVALTGTYHNLLRLWADT